MAAVQTVALLSHAQAGGQDLYVSELSRCQPDSAVSYAPAPGTWRLIPYESEGPAGTMIAAPSFINAPDVTLPLECEGWHAVWLGLWDPGFAYDGSPAVKVRLSRETVLRRIYSGASPDSQQATYLREVYFDDADLTGQDLVVGKMNGSVGRSAFLAYVRLAPLSSAEIAQVEADRARTETRNLVAAIDGISYFHHGECTRLEHVLELVEPYRHSDVGKVLWAVTYGDGTNFPSRVQEARFVGAHSRQRHAEGPPANAYISGERQAYESLRAFAAEGVMPQQAAAHYAHSMGLKFDLMFRLGILGDLGLLCLSGNSFVDRHRDLRQVLADGTVLHKASYAFEEVQDFSLALIRDGLRNVDADGVNLCFVRGPHFLQYEEPILTAFQAQHDEDARNVAADDPRLLRVRAEIMTGYVQDVRRLLDEIGEQRGRRLELSVWVWPSEQNVWLGRTPVEEGLDVQHWIREDLLDSVICQEGVDREYMELGAAAGCRFVLFTGYRGDKAMSPQTVTQAYQNGVTDFAYWDIDYVQAYPEQWNWLRRIGHRDEMADWSRYEPKGRLIRLKTVAGIDVEKGLADAVYSGG